MPERILVYLNHDEHRSASIALSVSLAQQHGSRLHGLSIFDDRHLQALWASCESSTQAAMLVSEQNHLRRQEMRARTLHEVVADTCELAGVPFKVRQYFGDPLRVLAQRAARCDLVVIDHHASMEIENTAAAVSKPLLLVRSEARFPERVLLTYDGSEASRAAIEMFARQSLCPEGELRLLAVADTATEAEVLLNEMAPILATSGRSFERGYLCGPFRRVLPRYAAKWDADLIVAGTSSKSRLLERFFGSALEGILAETHCSLYLLHHQPAAVTKS